MAPRTPGDPSNPFNSQQNPVVLDLMHKTEVQRTKYRHTIVVPSTAVPMNGSASAIVTIGDDADFYSEEMTGVVYGPTDINGVPQFLSATTVTDFPELFGAAYWNGAAGVNVQVPLNRAIRGLSVQVTDIGAARKLTDGYVPLDEFLTPGYGYQLYRPMVYTYLAKRQAKLQFEFKNRDTGGASGQAYYHYVSIALHGNKYEPRI
jgi:hypothetical protein